MIFYSLGNFLFETETVNLQPYDAYLNKRMPLDTKVGAYMNARSKNGTVGYGVLENIWRSVIAGWTMEDGKIVGVRLYPITVEGAESPFPSSTPRHIVLVTDYLHNVLWPNPGKWTFDIRIITLGMNSPRSQRGVPRLARDAEVLEYLQTLSEPFGTYIRIEDNVGFIDL